MSRIFRTTFTLFLLLIAAPTFADEPGAEFFVVETKALLEAAKSSEQVDALSSTELQKMCEISGTILNAERTAVSFSSKNFRIDLSFNSVTTISSPNTKSIDYTIAAGGPNDWSVAFLQGIAKRQGNSFIDPTWKSKPKTVIIRFINFKR